MKIHRCYCSRCGWVRPVNPEFLCSDCFAVVHPWRYLWMRFTRRIRRT